MAGGLVVNRDETLYRIGEPADRVFRLQTGLIKLTFSDGSIRIIQPQGWFEERVVFDAKCYNATAVAMCRCQVEVHAAKTLRESGTAKWKSFAFHAVQRAERAELRATGNGARKIAGRVDVLLSELAAHSDPVGEVCLTQIEIATLICAARESTNAALGDLVQQGKMALVQIPAL